MKSYGQFCALARSLDVVGDRWTLLIVRELLIGPCRYSDLKRSLPGIASNLLADRLRALVDDGLVAVVDEPPPTPAKVYSLTARGRDLQPVLVALAHWGIPYMARGSDGDRTRGRWLGFAVMSLYPDTTTVPADVAPLAVRIDSDGEHLLIDVAADGISVTPCPVDAAADVVIGGSADEVFAVLADRTASHAEPTVRGTDEALRRLRALVDRAATSAA